MNEPTTTLLRPLPRPPGLQAPDDVPIPPLLRTEILQRPPAGLVLRRLGVWARVAASFYGRNLAGRLAGRTSLTDRARRLADALQATGGTALTLGRCLASRPDLLPAAHCAALATLDDAVPAGPPPAPGAVLLRSTPTSAVWAWTTTAGEARRTEVAPDGAAAVFAADLVAIRSVLFATEWLNLLPPGFADALEDEVRQHLASELDLEAQARFARVLRKVLDDDDVRGVHVAVPAGDGAPQTITQLTRLDPGGAELDDVPPEARRAVARRLLEVGWWTAFHAVVQHAPRPGDLGLLGDDVVIRRLTDAGPVEGRLRRLYRDLLRRLARGDTSGAADVVLQLLSPVPFVDLHAVQRRLEDRLARAQLALRDPAAAGDERTSAVVWAAVFGVAREHGLPVRSGLIRLMRCALAHDRLALRLDPQLDLLRSFGRYERRDRRRAARRLRDQWDDVSKVDARAALVAGLGEATERLERLAFFVDALTSHPPVQYLSLTGKAAYAASVVLSAATAGTGLVLGVGALVAASTAWTGAPFDLLAGVLVAIAHPAVLAALALLVYLALRRVQIRLADVDGGG